MRKILQRSLGAWGSKLGILWVLASLMGTYAQAQVNANFTADVTSGCSPLTVRFTDLSTGNVNEWFWDFGNGNTSTFDDVIAVYSVPGTYTVSLTVRDTVGGFLSTRTETGYITVFNDPAADFAVDTNSGCAPLSVNFSENVTLGDAGIQSYTWDFGDGNLGSGANPNHIYTAAGTFTATLVVVDSNGCQDTRIYNDLVTVSDVANISFTATPQTGCAAPLTVTFNSTVTPTGTYSYLWDFGDGNTSNAEDPTHIYLANGDYDVSLTIIDGSGCQETVTQTNFVLINQPTAEFSALDTTICTGQSIQFINESIGADSYLWNFGDGNTSTQTNPFHTYATPGTYSVSLEAINSAGCSDIEGKSGYITVNVTPAPGFTADQNISCNSPMFVNFTDNSTGTNIAWEWDFGNGSFSLSQNPTTVYLTPGLYDVSLTVTSADGCQATETVPNYIFLGQPDAEFAMSRVEGCIPLSVEFTDLSTSPTDPIVTWSWNFGDGTGSAQQNPTHVYTAPGQYTVTLTTITASGCTNVETFQFIEAGTLPTAEFDANPLVACVGDVIQFQDLTTGGATEWEWNFGDDPLGSAQQNPAYTYNDTGSFNITLVVSNLGCRDTLTKLDFIRINGPVADFSFTPTVGCNPPLTVAFLDESSVADTYIWDFGDGNTSTAQNPTHTYTGTGDFTITLTVSSTTTGCVDNEQANISITNPTANFTSDVDFGCGPLEVNFTETSSNATAFFWDFGDGNTSTAANPTHTYAASGEFTVTLIASDGNCADTLVRTNYIDVIGPDANFSAGTLTGCAPLGVTFTDLSVADSGTSLVNWQWDFGDGGVGTGPNPTYTFNTPGDYDITLRVLDSEGCIDSITRTSYIQPTFPTAEFTTTDSTGCPGSLISFINQSIGQGLSYNWDFGDGTSSSAPNPIHLFPGNGNYNITLTVTDANGCSDARVKSSFISIANPTANFVADTTSATCPPLTVNFTDISSADVVSWYWDFGDGSTSTLANPSKIYATAGDFTVRLIVESNDGCRDTMEMTDLVQISGPTGTFGFNPVAGCNPLNVTFSVNSPDPSYTYDWDFGDGTGGTGTTINHTYFNDTTINPTMLIEDASGCIVSVTSPNPVEIYPLPVPAYTVTVTEICLGESLTFTNTTTSERAIVDFTWIFGDGDSSNLTNPSHTYLDTGMYVVQLVATTVDGCEDTAASPITIRVTAPPTAAFTAAPTAACEPASVAFLESSSGYFPIVDWAWDFGDGVGDNGQIITPHTYINDGIYAATLTVTDNRGCTGSSMRNITVNPLPDVDFSAFRYGCAPLPVAFTDLTTGSFPATDWEWDFGDGLTSTQQNPTHIYANDGNYTVTLTVTDTNGCRRTLTRNNYIQLGRPNAAFSSNAGITCPPQTVNFNNLSLGDTTISYAWDFGDGVTSNLANPTHTYSTSDTFDVRLVVTNIFGCTDTALDPQHVITYDLPIPSFTVSDSQACVPENIIFTSTSTPSPSGAALVSYQWDFGTGTGTTTPTTSFLYTSDGTYTASLTVTDANGCSNSTTRTIRIFPDPVVDFVAGDTVGCAVTSIGFTDMTTGSFAPVTWLWDFGDGTTGTGQNPVHTYFNDGSYDIKLVATDINGCVDSLTRPNYINLDHPDADFNVSAVLACPGEVISFTDISTGPFAIVTWDWDFGDGSISNAQDPSHAYASPGTYTVTLIVSDGINCRDTIVKTALVNVYTGPSAAYTYVPSNGCNPLTVNFTDGSSSGSVGIVSHLWTFGDGNGSAQQNPIYTFTSPGVYDVRLLVTDANGCVDTVTQSVEVFEVPDVAFTADIRRGCSPLTVNFSDLTTSPYVKVAWEWDFGDGNTSNAPSPSHTYTDNGDYTVKLVVTDQNGCKDSVIHNDFIRLSQPFANFTLDRAEVCPNEPIGVQFTDGTVHDTTLTSWSWSFGTGDNSTDQNPLYTYATPGVYNVTLEVTDLLGCTDDTTFTNIISVLTPATASFMMSDTLDCIPLGISFTDTSVPGDTALQAWLWDFGTGDSSLQQNPSYVWTTPGIYTVRLTVTDENGCLTTDSTTVQAYELPTADFFTADTLGCSPAVITFTENSTSAAPIAYRRWDFGDGTFVENVLNPTKTYAGDGDYTVSLLVRDVNGCEDVITKVNYIRLSHPVAQFSFDQAEVCPGIPVGVTFMDQSIPDHPLVSWDWDFGDGNSSALQNPTYSYAIPGNYSVILTVTNIYGCTDSDTVSGSITVLNPPTAAFSAIDTADCAPFSTGFLDLSTTGDTTLQSWTWDFGDGNGSLQQNPAHVYPNPNTYTVQLTVTDANGCQDSAQLNVESYEHPVADFMSADTLGCAGQSIDFADLSTGPTIITTWLWDFGDGNSSTFKNPSHTYTANGVYTVSLTVTDLDGCIHTVTKPDYIRLTSPVADFDQDRRQACPGGEIRFADLSVPDHPLTDWLWDFGDGNTSTDQNPTHIYANPGFYNVSLTVTNIYGCTNTLTRNNLIEIFTPPTAQFNISDSLGCVPFPVTVTNTSVGNSNAIASFQWTFGNGDTSVSNTTTATYLAGGAYDIVLEVIDTEGCVTTTQKTINAFDRPTAGFFTNDVQGCVPLTASFSQTSSGPAPMSTFTWDFGDGNTSTQSNPTHTYQDSGLFTVQLIVTDFNGCADTLVRPDYIKLTEPVAEFTASSLQLCEGQQVTFTDASIPDTTILNYFWNFGDGTTGTGSTVQHVYASDGNYTVQLIIENVVGCRDTMVKTSLVQVADKPEAQFVPSDVSGCAPFATSFTNTTIVNTFPIASYAWDFGNGDTSNLPNPNASYPTPGVYTVRLVATDQNGCADTVSRMVEAFSLPLADFTSGDTLGCAPSTSIFVSTSTGSYPISSYLWSFGDGNTSNQQFPTHVYSSTDTFDVTLQIEDINGCRDTITKQDYVRLSLPAPDFTVDTTSACPGTSLTFMDNSVPDHPLTGWLWDFGDGTTSTSQNPTHVYSATGFYDVTLTVTNVYGCSESITKVQFVEILSPPTAQFTLSDTAGCVPFTLNLLNTSVGNSGTVTGILWDLGNGDSSTLNNPVITYPTSGTYNIRLTVTDDNGCISTATESIAVFDGPTASFFTNDVLGCPPHTVGFTNTSTGPASIASYAWDFGVSGSSSTLPSPTFTYNDTGSYHVSLMVEDVNGCRDTLVRTDYIQVREPQADFTTSSTQLCEGERVTFMDASTGDTTLVNWFWDFGDGNTAIGDTVQHTYTADGAYTVRLIIENVVGCRDTIERINFIQVSRGPNAAFTLSSSADCAPFALTLTNTSTATTFPIAGYAWDFGNGDTSNTLNPSVTYPIPGVYTVRLIATDQNGCSDTVSQNVESYSLPFADFESADTVGCAPQSVVFVNTSGGSNGLANFAWNFGDGNTSTDQFPTHVYANNNIYDVSLWVEDVNGCLDSITKQAYIRLSLPMADFTVDMPSGCPGTPMTFSDNSTPDTTLNNWAWDFGDGTTGTGATVSHIYALPGQYTVTLTVTNVLGCEDTEEKTAFVNILNPPTAAFIPVDSQECTPLITIFNDASTAGDGTIISWNWDLGNGNTSASTSPTGIYPLEGTYDVSLMVTDANGCVDSVTRQVTALTLPVADFVASDTLGCSQDITFTDLTVSPYNITGWKWYFGDGDSSTLQAPTHTYFFSGTYDVTLIIFDEFGCTDTISKPNYINLTRPVALFAQDQDVVCPGTEVAFFDFSIPDFPIIDWSWDFGDGGSGSGQFPTHTFTTPGAYTVTLTVTNTQGCTDTETALITVNTPPQAAFNTSTNGGCVPLAVSFTDMSQAFGGVNIISRQWDFGDGIITGSVNPNYIYQTPGVYTVTLTVTDGNGCTHDTTTVIDAQGLPTIDFTVDQSVGCPPANVTFTNETTTNAGIQSFLWHFGDGDSSALTSPSHTYTDTGAFDVQLIAFDVNGCSDTLQRDAYIRLSFPDADFTYTPDEGCPGLTVQFTDISTPDTTLDTWIWDFGDGSTGTGNNPQHTYNTPGLYTVSLTVVNVLGCSNTETKTQIIEVNTPPSVDFSPSDTAACVPLSLTFFNTSTGNTGLIQGYEWDFGNGQTSTLVNPSATFTQSGIYQVKLIVTDNDGCIDSVTHPVNVRALPSPDFTVNDSLGCAPATFLFVDQSLASGNIISRLWDFGDGTTATQPFPNHTYNQDTTFTVSLTITDEFGCVNTIVRPDLIKLTPPDADFVMDQDAVCPGTDIQFTDVSNGIAPVISWSWDFGDGTTSTLPNPVHAYAAPGTYTVSMTIFDDRGCTATVTKVDTIEIFGNPNAGYTPSAFSGCPPLSVTFTNTTGSGSSPILNWQWDFDNGNNSIFTDPVEVFSNPGAYDVRLIATDDNGCRDTVNQTITVFTPPVADFAAPDTIGCAPIDIAFLDQTQPGSGNLASWSWTFGDGGTSSVQFPTYTYTSDGTYDVSLQVVDVNGCSDAVAKSDYIRLTRPTANFLPSATQICPGTNMSFLDISNPDTTIVGWFWDFGDGTTSTDPNPVHVYTIPGQYTISLTITNILGCSHTLMLTDLVEVLEGPNALYTPSDLEDCTPFTAEFVDNSIWTTSPIVSWAWDFGNGNTSNAQNPNNTFMTPGTYTATLTVTDNQGCSSTFTRDLTALVLPTANFISLDTLGCAPHSAQFTDLSTGPAPIMGWAWDFGDNETSNAQFPSHDYASDGEYDVELQVVDDNGCRDTLLKPTYIRLTNPQADFAVDTTGGCPGLTVNFSDTSIPDTTIVSWLWDFGDGTTSIVQNPTHTYSDPGSYTVSMTITNVKGCSQTATQTGIVQVSVPPVANFLLADSISCAPFAIDISDNTQTVSAPITSWSWDFGTGDVSTLQEPDYTYPTPGSYVINLQVVDANGCGDQVSKIVIATDRPVADFISPDTLGCAPTDVAFFDQTVGPYPLTDWEWSFGDFSNGNGQNTTHTYTADGIYDVQLVVTDQNGCRDTVRKENYIRLSHPKADFTLDETVGCPGLDVSFSDLSLPDTTLVGWLWDFGDGAISVQQNPTHSFDAAGEYDVKLTVTNILGCQDSILFPNAVRITTPPVASFTASDTSGCVPFSVNFVNFSTASAGVADQQWIIDGIAKGQSANFSQFFDQVGEYEVILIVTDANGCSDTATQMVFVRPIPVADFTTSDVEGCSPEVITFFDLTVHAPTQWAWEFGDGGTSNEQNPVYTYQEDGIYTVKLTVTDEYGCTDEAEQINLINLDHPEVDFTADYTPSCPPMLVDFSAQATGLAGIAKWEWDFGNGVRTTTLTPDFTYSYPTNGVFDVTLTATDSNGCATTVIMPDMITVLGDVIPDPIQISKVSVVKENMVEITFSPHNDDDFQYYTVYREEDGVGFVPIGTIEYINETVFYDETATPEQGNQCYKVTVTNYCGSESNLGLTETHCTVEASTTILTNQILVRWTPYIGWAEVEQYEVYSVDNYNPDRVEFLAVLPGTTLEFLEPVENCFTDKSYRIRAIGTQPDQISWSDTTSAISQIRNDVPGTRVIRATIQNNDEILLEWDDFNIPGASILYVEKSVDGGPFTVFATLPPGETKFQDLDVNVSLSSYSYRVYAQDSCGSRTIVSNEGKTILLEAKKEGVGVRLNWTVYSAWRFGVRQYIIEVYNETTNLWELVDIVQGTDNDYLDTQTNFEQASYCYRIRALELGGNEAVSLSNEACITRETLIFAPSAFTPNGDGNNDFFEVKGILIESAKWRVFSRWGMLLYEGNSLQDRWDGTFRGDNVKDGVYVYVVEGVGKNGQNFVIKGTVTIIR